MTLSMCSCFSGLNTRINIENAILDDDHNVQGIEKIYVNRILTSVKPINIKAEDCWKYYISA